MTQLKYAISSNFINDKEIVDNFLAWYEMASRKQKRIFCYLQQFSRYHNCVFPGQDRIAEKAGCGREWVNRTLKRLEGWGFLYKKRRPYRSSQYYLHESLLRLDLNNIEIFRKMSIGYQQCEPLSTQNCLGKSHNSGHQTGHHSSSYNPLKKTTRTENVGVRFSSSLDGKGGIFGTEQEKTLILKDYLRQKSDIKKLCMFSLTAIKRSLKDYADYSQVCTVDNLSAFLTAHCKIYRECENTGITPQRAWEMHHAEKKQQGKRL